MNTGLLLIMILALVIVEGTIVIAMLISNEMRIREALEEMKDYTELITNLFKQSHKYEESLSVDMLRYSEKCDTQTKRYKDICAIAEKMCTRYKEIETGHKELLNCWKGVDERYDQTYEQFKLLSDELKKINVKKDRSMLSEIAKSICKTCPNEKCIHNDCPLYVFLDETDMQEVDPDLYRYLDKYPRRCELDSNQKCPYKKCIYKDCSVFVQKSVENPTLQDPIMFGGNKND